MIYVSRWQSGASFFCADNSPRLTSKTSNYFYLYRRALLLDEALIADKYQVLLTHEKTRETTTTSALRELKITETLPLYREPIMTERIMRQGLKA